MKNFSFGKTRNRLKTMFYSSFPNNINPVHIKSTHFMVSPSFQAMYNPSCMTCMHYSSSHCILHSHKY
ncbi:hypothetical protein Hanom_Chr17g01539261 [Helianthus anomalus]